MTKQNAGRNEEKEEVIQATTTTKRGKKLNDKVKRCACGGEVERERDFYPLDTSRIG